VTCVLTK